MTTTKWVVAGDYKQYTDWLFHNQYNRSEWRFVSDADVLRGHIDPHGIFIGTYYLRTDIRIILLQLQVSTHGTNPALEQAWKKVDIYAPQSI